jgi:ppGpp synthetase/RelA/SpoT-type nucleotidyltranferase
MNNDDFYMGSNLKVKEAVDWYAKNRFIYEAVCTRVEAIIEEVLNLEKINYHSVTSRAKSVESYRLKALKGKYKEPKSEIMDMAGIRAITYTDSDSKRVFEIVNKTFDVYTSMSSDKSEKLGVDKVGYRSLDCIATLGKARLKLPENLLFKDVCFEIQIRTILQHAWAEFEHDRNYKFNVELPVDLRRRLFVIAGNLELVDREFDSLSKEIDTYVVEVEKGINKGALDIPINSLSLTAYLTDKLKDLINAGVVAPEIGRGEDIVFEELAAMGIKTLKKLDEIIPKDFSKKASPYYMMSLKRSGEKYTLYPVILDILIISDAELYFKKVWNNKWQGIEEATVSLYESYGVDFEKYVQMYGLDIL